MEITSKTTGNMLKLFLTLGMVLSSILVVTTFFYAYFYEVFLSISIIDQAVTIINVIIWIITIILYLVWIYKVHKDLRNLNATYPIKPSGALARILIPVYNLYGLWNIFSTMVDFLKGNTSTAKHAKRIGLLIPFYYILFFVTDLLNRLIGAELIFNDHVLFLSYVLDAVLMVVFLMMTKSIFESLNIMGAEYIAEAESEELPGEVISEETMELEKPL
ncbi:hypothetical protein GMD78_07645 [Ornithinibacillus sp. L9]|uniref:DUF4328 domain-containing protein n=1 Tax=Ornithinibacillus caprae TaxID=2678566 RepID=A0A6N8FEY9_9BACI|nr:DUF4328 domain-containing protein [Ornithinibacillus caprae]MUK88262.1 hypothetical protein [Ornithinibacillus caprae]